MCHRTLSVLVGGLALAFGSLSPNAPSATSVPASVSPEAPGLQIETRGPVHEAFAQPHELNAEPNPPVPKAPPPGVQEEAPEQRPEGDNVQWLPGYWAWDADRNEYIWI